MLPVILAFGTFGNILCIITLLNKRFQKTSTGFILIQMALLDIAQMVVVFIAGWEVFNYRDYRTRDDVLMGYLQSSFCVKCAHLSSACCLQNV